MINIIRIKKASFYGYHGVMSEEKSMGGKFEADVDLYTDFCSAAEKDSLKETINYHEVYKLLYHVVLEEKHYLIETLAVKVADKLLTSFPKIQRVAVRIRKNNPPLGGVTDCVEAEIIKSRDEL